MSQKVEMSVEIRKRTGKGAANRRALLKRELGRWLPLLLAHEQPERIILFGSFLPAKLVSGQIWIWSSSKRRRLLSWNACGVC